MARKRYIEQIEKEKEELQHKLGYIDNTLQHLTSKTSYLRKKSVTSSPPSPQHWRRQHKEAMKELVAKKKEI